MEDVLRVAVEEAVRLGAEYAEARLQEVESYGFALRNGCLEPPTFRGDRGVYVRVSVDGCLGFASTNSLSGRSILKLAK
ncbi:MAG: DNA gyrase modulator, partial [Candidatus Bathyarchaeia archaeon]